MVGAVLFGCKVDEIYLGAILGREIPEKSHAFFNKGMGDLADVSYRDLLAVIKGCIQVGHIYLLNQLSYCSIPSVPFINIRNKEG